MTEKEFRKKLHDLEDEYIRAPLEIQNQLDELAEKYHIILNTFVNSENFSKEKYYQLLDDYYNEYVTILFSYKNNK